MNRFSTLHRNTPDRVLGPRSTNTMTLVMDMIETVGLVDTETDAALNRFLSNVMDKNASLKFKRTGTALGGKVKINGDVDSAVRMWVVELIATSGRSCLSKRSLIEVIEAVSVLLNRTSIYNLSDDAMINLLSTIEEMVWGPCSKRIVPQHAVKEESTNPSERFKLFNGFRMLFGGAVPTEVMSFLQDAPDESAYLKIREDASVAVRGDARSAVKHFVLRKYLRSVNEQTPYKLVDFLARMSHILSSHNNSSLDSCVANIIAATNGARYST